MFTFRVLHLLLAAASSAPQPARAGARTGVRVEGSTRGPGFVRPEGKRTRKKSPIGIHSDYIFLPPNSVHQVPSFQPVPVPGRQKVLLLSLEVRGRGRRVRRGTLAGALSLTLLLLLILKAQ